MKNIFLLLLGIGLGPLVFGQSCDERALGTIVIKASFSTCNQYTTQKSVNFSFPDDNLSPLVAAGDHFINFDDGAGDIPLEDLPSPLNLINRSYSSVGTKNIKVKALVDQPDGPAEIEVLHEFSITINITTSDYFPPDEILSITTAETYDPPSGCVAYNIDQDPFAAIFLNNVVGEAKAYVRFGIGHSEFVKPIIIVDGLDFSSTVVTDPNLPAPDNVIRNGSNGWDALVTGTTEGFFEADEQSEFWLYPALLDELYAAGFDFVFLDFGRGSDYIQKNAILLKELLLTINDRKIADPNTGIMHENVVVGASMGGQIARYALAKMEQDGIDHCTHTYASFDSPHKGANVAMGIQSAAWFRAMSSSNPADKGLWHSLNHPAPRQLLVEQFGDAYQEGRLATVAWAPGSTQYPSRIDVDYGCLRDAYVAEMAALGYPEQTRNISISCGSINAIDQGYGPNTVLYHADLESTSSVFNEFVFQTEIRTIGGGVINSSVGNVSNTCFPKHNDYPFGINSIYVFAQPRTFKNCLGLVKLPRAYHSVGVISVGPFENFDNAPGCFRRDLVAVNREISKSLDAEAGGGLEKHIDFLPEHKTQCFMPTMSTLDLDLEMNDANMALDLSTMDISTISPFDAYYAPVGYNLKHVEIDEQMKDWIINELLSTQNSLSAELPASPWENTFNLGLGSSRISTIDINDGGVLRVNNSGPTGFLNGEDSPHKVLEVFTGGCNNGNVTVKDGGRFILGDDLTAAERRAIVHLSTGSKVEVEAGGLLRVAKGSQLIIEAGAQLIIHEGANVDLWWNDFWFDGETIEGSNILVKDGGELIIHGNFSFGGSGFFQFDKGNILTLTNDWKLEGNGKGQRFMRLNEAAVLEIPTVEVELKWGKVEYALDSYIGAIDKAVFKLTHMEMEGIEGNSPYARHALLADGASKVDFLNTFIHGFLEAVRLENMTEDLAKCTMQICEFEHNRTSIATSKIREMYIGGCSFTREGLGLRAMYLIDAPDVTVIGSRIEGFRGGIYIPELGAAGDDDGDGIDDGLANNTNLLLRNGTSIENNERGIQLERGGVLSSGQIFGRVTMDCAKLIENHKGIVGNNIHLQIDACINSGQPGACDKTLINSNTFINAIGGQIFNIGYEDDLNNPNYLETILPGCEVTARGNYWQASNGSVGPLADTEYSLASSSVVCPVVDLNMADFVQGLPTNCSNGGTSEPGPTKVEDNKRSSEIDAPSIDAELQVFPNPSSGEFTVRFSAYPAIVSIKNMLGQTVFAKAATGELHLNARNWDAGLYLIEVTNTETSATVSQKMVIQK